MSLRDSLVESMPAPNPDNAIWMGLAASLVTGGARSGNIYIFVIMVYITYMLICAVILWKIVSYLWSIYSQRLFETGAHVRTFAWALGIAAVFGLLGVAMFFSQDYNVRSAGEAVLCLTFGAFAVFTAFYDWWVSRPAYKQLPSLRGVTAEEVLKMNKTVKMLSKGS
jgi:hypothetical protein